MGSFDGADHAGFVRFFRTAAFVAVIAGAAGCGVIGSAEKETYLGSAPTVSGNTFDRYNDMAIVPPVSENLSISYQFELQSDSRGDAVAGVAGPVWLYSERSAALPGTFVQIALLPGPASVPSVADGEDAELAEAADPAGQIAETVRLGRLDYISRMACVQPGQVEGLSPDFAAMLRNVGEKGFGLSEDVFVRSFESEQAGLDGKRVAVLYVRDVTRLGYDCDGLGDLFVPEPDAQEAVNLLREEAGRSFEVIQ